MVAYRSRSAGLRGEKVGEDDVDDAEEADEVALCAAEEPVGDCRLARAAAAAALAALLMGTWIPSEGRESDLRRVLYGMLGGRVVLGGRVNGLASRDSVVMAPQAFF